MTQSLKEKVLLLLRGNFDKSCDTGYTMVTTMETPNTSNRIETPPYSKDQDHIDKRGIETLITTLSSIPESQHDDILITLRNREAWKLLFERQGIAWGGTVPELISRLEGTLANIERRKRQFIPAEEPMILKDSESEAVIREEAMEIQSEINELYRLNYEVLDEEERLKKARASLEVFASDRISNEKVQVARTAGGSVEVLFEEDVKEAEVLHQETENIRDTEKRIEAYNNEIQELESETEPGILGKFFSKNTSESDPDSPKEKLKIKKMKTELELTDKITQVTARQDRLQLRLEEKRGALSVPLMVAGIDQFSGTWEKLLEKLQAGMKTASESLEQTYQERQVKIQELEAKRDGLSNDNPVGNI